MPRSRIYVVQVVGGTEEKTRRAIAREVGEMASDTFIPLCETTRRVRGSWRPVRTLLFPGYVFVQTADPQGLAAALRRVSALSRLLVSSDGSPKPLTDDEAAWLDAVTDTGTHVMGMSRAVAEGDHVVVVSGPLKGRESQITKVDRHKRVAWIEVRMLGRRTETKVGLEVVRRRGA